MARRVILDTGVLIAIERGNLDVDAVLGVDDGMMIAATAASTSRILLTTDASAEFGKLTGVRAELLKLP